MSEIMTLTEAVAELVHDGASVALEGFTHLVPFAAGHEIIRQRRHGLELIRMAPDVLYDRMIGAGCAAKLVFSHAENSGVGALHRFRDAVLNGWPQPLEVEEYSYAGMANRYAAGAAGLPFGLLRGHAGTDLPGHPATVRTVTCPFTGVELAAVAALNPDLAIVHAQRADRAGNVAFWGVPGVQKEAVLAAKRTLVTVEEIVDELEPVPGAVLLPGWMLDAVAVVSGGARPSAAYGYYPRDDAAYSDWDLVSGDRERFAAWCRELVAG